MEYSTVSGFQTTEGVD